MNVDGRSQVVGIFGDPVAHSLSPAMQNAAISAAGINAVYVPFHVERSGLRAAVDGVRALGLTGVNVTVPHKEAVLSLLDEIEPLAVRVGAVNTIVNRGGRLVGFNTDVSGFQLSLNDDLGFDPSGKDVVILGAGGAARAAVVAVLDAGAARVTIVNRTADAAERLAAEFSGQFPDAELVSRPLDPEAIKRPLASAHLLVNSTSLGLHGETFPVPVIEGLGHDACFYDMVYAPELTSLQQISRARGVLCADGRGMLVGQGEVAFRLWFGVDAPAGVMRSALF